MRLHRFYIPNKIGSQKEIVINSSELINQIKRVFRLKKGDSVVMFDGSGNDFECLIESFTDDSVVLNIGNVSQSRFMPIDDLRLYVALVKKDTFEWIVEKATELGVAHIIPVMAERSEKKNLNNERLRKISIEASEQSGRGCVPIIEDIVDLETALSTDQGRTSAKSKKIAFHTEGVSYSHGRPSGTSIFIGPEGGWSPREIQLFHENNVSVACLGKQILRTETAVISALSVIIFGN